MSILTMHHGLMAGIKRGDPPGYVTIGGRLYRTVTIGTQTWLAENLDYKWEGLVVGSSSSSSEARGNYFNNDEATYGYGGSRECGLMYNITAAKYIEDNKASICQGWHIPTESEWETLISFAGGVSTKLKKSDDPIWGSYTWNGTDDYGFGVLPGGYYDGTFNSIGGYTGFLTAKFTSGTTRIRGFLSNYSAPSELGWDYSCYYIRLVKDAT